MQKPWLWPVLAHDENDIWWWQLSDGELSGRRLFSSVDENGSACRISLGPAEAFDVGFASTGQPRVLLQRPSGETGSRLEFIRPNGGEGPSAEIVAQRPDACYPHFIPGRSLADAKSRSKKPAWQPGWLNGSEICTAAAKFPTDHIRQITWLVPTGGPRGNWWGFEGVSCDDTAVAGVLGPDSGGQLWRASSQMVPLVPAYCHGSRRLYFLAAFWQDDGCGAGVVGRYRSGRRISESGSDWSPSRLQWSWSRSASSADDSRADVAATFGGAVSCPTERDILFWSPAAGRRFCLQGTLGSQPARFEERFAQIRPVGRYGQDLLPQPVRVRGLECPAASDGWECFTVGWGVHTAAGFALMSVPPECPLSPGALRLAGPPVLSRGQPVKLRRSPEPADEKKSVRPAEYGSRLRSLRRAMNAALAEVEQLRRQNSQLRDELSKTDRR